MSTTIGSQVFAEATTRTIHVIAQKYQGVLHSHGYVFPDNSVVTIDAYSIGYTASMKGPK